MKINERTLISLSTSASTPSDREGWLWKRGEVNKAFQKRYCVLKGNLLFYFDRRGDKEPLGVIILEGCTIELAEEEFEKFAFKIAFHGEGKRTYVLGTDSQDALEEWMKLLACASYDYMKLMVLELQQQLSELEEAERSAQVGTVSNGHEPKAPPRQRQNPFNTGTEDRSRVANKMQWLHLHKEFGTKIVRDREVWCRSHLAETGPLL